MQNSWVRYYSDHGMQLHERNKIKQIIAGMIIGLITALLIRLYWTKDAMILGALVALLAGAAKEVFWDNWYTRVFRLGILLQLLMSYGNYKSDKRYQRHETEK